MTTRLEVVETFTGDVVKVLRIEPYVSRGKNSLPVPSPRPVRGQRLEYPYTEVSASLQYRANETSGRVIIQPEWFATASPELDWLEMALGKAVTPERKRKWWRFW